MIDSLSLIEMSIIVQVLKENSRSFSQSKIPMKELLLHYKSACWSRNVCLIEFINDKFLVNMF